MNLTDHEIEQRKLAAEYYMEEADGKPFPIQARRRNRRPGSTEPEWNDIDEMNQFIFHIFEYRRKPQVTLVPWTLDDVTHEIAEAWFQCGKIPAHYKALWWTDIGMALPKGCHVENGRESLWVGRYSFEDMFQRVRFSLDLKTWHPCGKPAPQFHP